MSAVAELHYTQQTRLNTRFSLYTTMTAHVHDAGAPGCTAVARGASVRVSAHDIGFFPSTDNCYQCPGQEKDGQTAANCSSNGLHEDTANAVQLCILGKLTRRYTHRDTRVCPYGRERCHIPIKFAFVIHLVHTIFLTVQRRGIHMVGRFVICSLHEVLSER